MPVTGRIELFAAEYVAVLFESGKHDAVFLPLHRHSVHVVLTEQSRKDNLQYHVSI